MGELRRNHQRLRLRSEDNDLTAWQRKLSKEDIAERYLQRITNDIRLARPLKGSRIGNGVPGMYALSFTADWVRGS